ncbi:MULTISPECIES: biliverdin-producing heme oxygenase [unclassified Pseudomonas]|uniref:biliverdin-producing heme oxygenase n=1 Tax=unclassified Pseudomonas TaxID=196821 RepID=UPI0025EA395A|nr:MULTISPECIES: biliverdin-producing heme oxygenase [unclassified Pseudomonas]
MVEATPELTSTSDSPALAVSVLQMLRTATSVQHKALEARLPLTHADLDRSLYTRIIEAYYGFHVPLQRHIDQFVSPQACDPKRYKVAALIKDLRALGLSDGQIDRLPLCCDLPRLQTQGHLLGIMYVIEGATLGGQVLRRIIADRLGIEADSGGEFLDVYGRDTGRRWKAFLKQLADFDQPEYNGDVVDAACATFASFERWLDRAGVLL